MTKSFIGDDILEIVTGISIFMNIHEFLWIYWTNVISCILRSDQHYITYVTRAIYACITSNRGIPAVVNRGQNDSYIFSNFYRAIFLIFAFSAMKFYIT